VAAILAAATNPHSGCKYEIDRNGHHARRPGRTEDNVTGCEAQIREHGYEQATSVVPHAYHEYSKGRQQPEGKGECAEQTRGEE
jgi:hypothetical protein